VGRTLLGVALPRGKKLFVEVAKAIGLKEHISPRAMRRTFQDLARAAEIRDLVTRAVSGHATEDMHRHYSTVQTDEIREQHGDDLPLLASSGRRPAREGRSAFFAELRAVPILVTTGGTDDHAREPTTHHKERTAPSDH
jgi:hypothetical protein